jgi:hypothetical protein
MAAANHDDSQVGCRVLPSAVPDEWGEGDSGGRRRLAASNAVRSTSIPVGRTGEKRTSDSQERRARASGCGAHRDRVDHGGALFARAGALERRRAEDFHRQPTVRATALESLRGAVDKATSFVRSRGVFEHVGVHLEPSGSFAQRRVIGERTATIGQGASDRAVYEPAPSFVRPASPRRQVGLVSRGVLKVIGFEVAAVGRHRAAWRVPQAVVVLSDVTVWRGLMSAPGVIRSVRGERRRVSRATVSGGGQRARRRAAFSGSSKVLALSNVVVTDRSFERPSNTRWSRRACRFVRSWSPRRAAHRAR